MEIPEGRVISREIDGRRIALCNVDGSLHAIDDLCSHDGAPLNQGYLEDTRITCPRHGARFDVTTGAAVSLPAVLPVRRYEVAVHGEEVFVILEDK